MFVNLICIFPQQETALRWVFSHVDWSTEVPPVNKWNAASRVWQHTLCVDFQYGEPEKICRENRATQTKAGGRNSCFRTGYESSVHARGIFIFLDWEIISFLGFYGQCWFDTAERWFSLLIRQLESPSFTSSRYKRITEVDLCRMWTSA